MGMCKEGVFVVDTNPEQQQQKQEQQEALWPRAESDEVAPGVPVIRTNTPRPMTFEAMMASQLPPEPSEGAFPPPPSFPSMAPSAPPLPEEVSDEQEESSSSLTAARAMHAGGGDAHEFCWLFEYGLEMDPATLNTPERLNGLALLYGKGVLRGYRLLLGSIEEEGGPKTIVTIVPDTTPGAQVWGVLYRIPKRLTNRSDGAPSALDSAHALTSIEDASQQLRVIVRDVQHDRELSCITYAASERIQRQLSPIPNLSSDPLFAQRLTALVRRHNFPEHYLHEKQAQPAPMLSGSAGHSAPYAPYAGMASTVVSHDTDPLPVMKEQRRPSMLANTLPETPLASSPATIPTPLMTPAALPRPSRLLLVFAAYLVLLLILAISFAILQGAGLWNNVLNEHFAPLSVPWMVMLYGLLGGCVSSLVTAGHYRTRHPDVFVLVTWFSRPFVGALLAAFSYLILTSGIFALDATSNHMPVFLLAGALAGLCEGILLFKRK
jgi:hypothetical protein